MKFIDNKKVGERLKKIRQEKQLSARKFAMGADLDPSHYGKVERGELPITETMLEKLKDRYKDLNSNFILYGDGINVPHETPAREELGPSYRTQLWMGKVMPDDEKYFPLVPFEARAGYSRNYENTDYIQENYEFHPLPPGLRSRTGTDWRWFEVRGDSMEPILHDKNFVVCSFYDYVDWEDVDFEIYCIVYNNDIVVKRLAFDKGDFVLVSENESQYPQKRIELSKVKEIWKVRRVVNGVLPPSKRFKITV